MASENKRFLQFTSAVYGASREIAIAITTAPDQTTREAFERIEAEVRHQARRHRLPSPDEPRIFFKEFRP